MPADTFFIGALGDIDRSQCLEAGFPILLMQQWTNPATTHAEEMMPHSTLGHDTWVLLCDARKAVLFQNAGDATYPKLEKRGEWEGTNLPAHEMGTARPGRTFSGKQGRRSAIQPKDMKRNAEREFLRRIADETDRQLQDSKTKRLVIVAPDRTLGELRPLLPPAVADSVQAEFDKDYLRTPVYEIERHLSQLLKERAEVS